MIHNIIHISDIHIRTGDSKKSRYDEYISTFDNLYESLSHQPSIIDKTAIIVITGDMFHDKNRIGPSGIKIAIYLLQKLSSLATVYIIRGNHDYRQDTPNELDMISSLMSYVIPNVIYLDKTGIYNYNNITFGLVAIQNTLLYGSTSGITSQLPDFPNPTNDIYKNTYKIALFHGTIDGSTMQNGLKTTRGGYPINWFQGYDAILLGDIHLQQINRVTKIENKTCNLPFTSICNTYTYSNEVPWGYPGSLIQQDFGETIKGHGYVLWDLQHKYINVYHIKNKYGMIKLIFNNDINKIEVIHKHSFKGQIKNTMLLNKIITFDWFPDNLHIRVLGENITSDSLQLITNKIQSFGKNILTITKKILNISNIITDTDNNLDTSEILNINSSDSLIEYINACLDTSNIRLNSDKWKQLLIHPEKIIISTENAPVTLKHIINKKSDIIQKLIDEYNIEFENVKAQQIISGNLKLHKLEWEWILNYKDKNIFDFDKDINNISIINAKNGNGKSNFLEIICIAIFGKGFPSRENKKYTANIICDKKPSGTMANLSITFTLNDIKYNIKRTIRNNSDKKKIDCEDIILTRITDSGNEIIHQKAVVNDWVKLNIGTHESYLMSAILSQNADNDFFNLDSSSQIQMLDRVLSITHIDKLKKLLSKSISYYKDISDLITTHYDGITAQSRIVDKKYVDELNMCKEKLHRVTIEKTELFNKWNMISEKDLYGIKDLSEINRQIKHFQDRIINLPSDKKMDIKNRINELDRCIIEIQAEIANLRSFSDLETESDIKIDEKINMLTIKEYILELETELKSHPFFQNPKKYNIYDNINLICNSINDDNDNNENNQDLFTKINNFENWNKIQNQKFSQDKKYFQDTSEIDKLKNRINELIQIIQESPNKLLGISKNIDKLRKQLNKLNKEKEFISDKRPNKASKTKEWLENIKYTIEDYGDLQQHLDDKEFIINSIKYIPIICNNLINITSKIQEYNLYIEECSNLPFNSSCDACKKQPWRTKYDSIIKELPELKSKYESIYNELLSLQYGGIQGDIQYDSYQDYINILEECLVDIQDIINNIQIYNSENELWINYDKWQTEYIEIKSKCDELGLELSGKESEKKEIEKVEIKIKDEKKELQYRLENIQLKQDEYDIYIKEFDIRNKEYYKHVGYLEYNWYSTLYYYRHNIECYLIYLNTSLKDNISKKIELEQYIESIKEREQCEHELIRLNNIYKAYPIWNNWKQIVEEESSISLKIKELETIINGANNSSSDSQMVDMIELANNITHDIDDITYISQVFDEYRDWLYKEQIVPLIQKKVNSVLEMICDDRPLYLECDWLKETKGCYLSWFIRDGCSRPVIQKASGFQRFIIGIAMRVAINQIGLSKMHYNEFFIDEGFTACDSDNLEKVPDFLKGLLSYYNSIYLATHLEELKGCTDNHIFIKRDESGLSQIQYGDAKWIKEIESTNTNKKKGRPPKSSIIVTKV
jgi:DNA repair exonuclease SbcCD ATPase subunit